RAALGPADGGRRHLLGAADDPLFRRPALHGRRHDRRWGQGLTDTFNATIGITTMGIRVAVGQFHDLTEERLGFAAQIGVNGLQMNNPDLPGDERWEQADVRALVDKVEGAGLKFEAIENVPTHFYHKAMMGLDGRDEQIENYQATIRAVARAGV